MPISKYLNILNLAFDFCIDFLQARLKLGKLIDSLIDSLNKFYVSGSFKKIKKHHNTKM